MLRRVSLSVVLLVFGSWLAVACAGGDDDDGAAVDATASAVAEDEAAESETGEPEQAAVTESPAEALPASTPTTDAEPAATATGSQSSESVLVIPPERDAGIPRDGRVLGDPDALVKVVEYGDFQ
jgi:hypothetical protein